MRSLPGIDELRASGNRPRVHPTGFVQFDLPGRRRLHAWPEQPIRVRQPHATIHSHMYGFTSDVHLGTIIDQPYALVEDPEGDYELRAVSYVPGGKDALILPLDDRRYRLIPGEERRVVAPGTYAMMPWDYHASCHEGLALSIIQMTEPDLSRPPCVAYLHGLPPVEPFRREGDADEEAMLWDLIQRALRAAA